MAYLYGLDLVKLAIYYTDSIASVLKDKGVERLNRDRELMELSFITNKE